ncbi:hypothetical protein F4780DRAFT_779996 [Xylariomycetidae sp. FL0641]|nr:hypothetical protein F4780DRAFT_779996 [Xylariomycetidae sp. FL0641]
MDSQRTPTPCIQQLVTSRRAPCWVRNPAYLWAALQAPLISAIEQLNRTLPADHAWWTRAMDPPQRAALILSTLPAAAQPRAWEPDPPPAPFAQRLGALFSAETIARNPQLPTEAEAEAEAEAPAGDRRAAYANAAHALLARALAACEHRRPRRRGIAAAALLSYPPRARFRELQSWVRDPERLARALRPAVVAVVRRLNGPDPVPGKNEWESALSTAQRVAFLGGQLAGNFRMRQVDVVKQLRKDQRVEFVDELFMPAHAEAVHRRLKMTAHRSRPGKDSSNWALWRTFWCEVERELLSVVSINEELALPRSRLGKALEAGKSALTCRILGTDGTRRKLLVAH